MPPTSDRPGTDRFQEAYPEALREAERRLVHERRSATHPAAPDYSGMTGIGLSGGGIRSATFCLGVFQALARRTLVGRADFLSTVSGGGYFGAFLGRMFSRAWVRDVSDVEAVLSSTPQRDDARSTDPNAARETMTPRVVEWLRQNGRYLAPRGAGDMLLMAAIVLRNWIAVQFALLVAVFALTCLLQLLRVFVEMAWLHAGAPIAAITPWRPWGTWPWVSSLGWLIPSILLLVALPTGWSYWLLAGPHLPGDTDGPQRKPMPAFVGAVALASMVVLLGWWGRGERLLADAWRYWLYVGSLAGVAAVVGWRLVPLLRDEPPIEIPPWIGVFVMVVGFACAEMWALAAADSRGALIIGIGLAVTVLSIVPARLALRQGRSEALRSGLPPAQQAVHTDASARRRLSQWFEQSLVWAGALVVLTAIDSLAENALRHFSVAQPMMAGLVALAGGLSTLAVPAGKVLPLLFSRLGRSRPRLSVSVVAGIGAVVILLGVLAGVDRVVLGIRWWGLAPVSQVTAALLSDHAVRLGLATGLSLLMALLVGGTWPFLNSSGQEPLYRARLTRTYLGATNQRRHDGSAGPAGAADTVAGDDLPITDYFGLPTPDERKPRSTAPVPSKGGPLHLINITINDTRSGGTVGQDRKGLAFAVGPCGLSAGVANHVVFGDAASWPRPESTRRGAGDPDTPQADTPAGKQRRRMNVPVAAVLPSRARTVFGLEKVNGGDMFVGENLTLGHCMAVSGAAFTTGTGYQTSFGLSFLAGFVNARLGYWWNSGRDYVQEPSMAVRMTRRLFAVQAFLTDEFLAHFHGMMRPYWYLSDGGHFENLGGYELLRRRIGFIVLVDAEADDDYSLGGLNGLIRKARIDFGARTHFLDHAELTAVLPEAEALGIGTLADIAAAGQKPSDGKDAGTPTSRAHAALAVVVYPGLEDWSILLYVKASVTGDEGPDIRQYRTGHPTFPHEATTDQFFDETQWESYRYLGEHIGGVVLASGLFERWSTRRPRELVCEALQREGLSD